MAYARVVETVPDFALPKDPLEWHATCHHNDPKLMEYAEFFADFKKSQYLKLMYVWGHSYEFDNNDNWDVIENFCKYMGGRDDIWYATNIEIIDYMDAAKRLQFSADYEKVYNPNACSVWLQLNSDKCVEIEGRNPGGSEYIAVKVKPDSDDCPAGVLENTLMKTIKLADRQ